MGGRHEYRRRGGLVGLLLTLLLVGCGLGAAPTPPLPFATATAPSVPTVRPSSTPRPIATLAPTVTAAPATPAPTGRTPTAGAVGSTTAPTPTALGTAGPRSARAAFSAENAYRHVEELSIGIGARAAGTEGEQKGATYVADQLTAMGYTVTRQPFKITTFQDNGSTLTLLDAEPRTIQPLAMYYSGSGQVEAPLALGGLGAPTDVQSGGVKDKIALIERGGGLTFQEKARNARAGGALAIIVYNNVEGSMQGQLAEPFDLPVVSVSRADGFRLRRLLESQRTVRASLKVNVATELKPSDNIVAMAPSGRPQRPIIIVGGHYDSVPAGPGANDNASGVAVMLELARVLAREDRVELRFVAFGAEEIGLVGSKAYATALTGAEKSRVLAMINLDMLAVGPVLTIGGSDDLVGQTVALAERLGIEKVQRLSGPRGTASDHQSFIEAGVPAVFIHRPDDANYHTAQDRAQFVKVDALQTAGTLSLRLIDQLLEKPRA